MATITFIQLSTKSLPWFWDPQQGKLPQNYATKSQISVLLSSKALAYGGLATSFYFQVYLLSDIIFFLSIIK